MEAVELPKKSLLRTAEVAGVLNCSERHIRNLIKMGRLEAMDIGGRRPTWRVPRLKLEAFFQALEKEEE